MLASGVVPRLSQDLHVRLLDHELYAVFQDGSVRIFRLNAVALDAWGLIDGQRSLEGLTTVLAARYEAPLDEISFHIAAFIEQLQKARVLELV